MNQLIIPVLSIVVGAAAGFMIGNSVSSDGQQISEVKEDAKSTYRSVRSSSGESSDELKDKRVRTLNEALALPNQTGRMEALMDYFAKLDPARFAEEADKLDDLPMGERMMVSYLLFSRWGEEDPMTAMAYTKTMGRMGGFMSNTVLKSWASQSPELAAKYYSENPNDFQGRGRGGQNGAATIASEWVNHDQDAALSWAMSLEGNQSLSAIRSIFNQVASSDPAEAALLLSSITDPAALSQAQSTIAREWGEQDWAAAEAWISSLSTDQQGAAYAQALRGLSDEDYLAAAEKLTSLSNVDDYANTMESITRDWSKVDPAAAASWVMENGTVEAQVDSIGPAVASWTNVDQVAAYEFVSQQELGDVRDEAAIAYIRANVNGDTNQNLALAESVSDANDRARAISRSVSSWMREDQEAATEYINSSELLTDNQKSQVIRRSTGGVRGRRN